MRTILITGFGPFPGAPFNPTIELVRKLAQLRRPALADVRLVGHVFETSYAAVDRDLLALVARFKPDAVLMFGLAARTRAIRIETRAHNALAMLPDVSGVVLRRGVIAGDGPAARAMPAPHRRLLAAALAVHVPAYLSRDAGRYLCNYACWRAVEAVNRAGGPKLAAFVHVPLVARTARPKNPAHSPASGNPGIKGPGPSSLLRQSEAALASRRRVRGDERPVNAADLLRTGTRVLVEIAAGVNRT